MTKRIFFSIAMMVTMLLSSCEAIEGIFKTGFYAGIIVVVLVIALVIWLVSKVFR